MIRRTVMPQYNGSSNRRASAESTASSLIDYAYVDYHESVVHSPDVMVKGQLKFPEKLYGREKELELLCGIYEGLAAEHQATSDKNDSNRSGKCKRGQEKLETAKVLHTGDDDLNSSDHSHPNNPSSSTRILFLSGYSGIGKSALISKLISQVQVKYGPSHASQILAASGFQTSPILHICGKYTKQQSGSAGVPFSAIMEALEKLAMGVAGERQQQQQPRQQGGGDTNNSLHSKVIISIRKSDLIGCGKEGNHVLTRTFPQLLPLLMGVFEENDDATKKTNNKSNTDKPTSKPEQGGEDSNNTSTSTAVHYSMNAIKECTTELLSIICKCLDRPLVFFLDDLQWADEASIDILSLLLTSQKLGNVMFICAYRSNEVEEECSFSKMKDKVKKEDALGTAKKGSKQNSTVHSIDLFSLSPDAIAKFIADTLRKTNTTEVADLSEAVYTKTMGNIFYVKQALEELVRRNILFYDYVLRFEWRWNEAITSNKMTLQNYMSDDVVKTVKGKIKELSFDVQLMLIVMAYIPNSVSVPMLKALMSDDASNDDGEEAEIAYHYILNSLLKEAVDKGMVLYSRGNNGYSFAHDRIRQASLEIAKEKVKKVDLLVHISQVMLNFANVRGPEMEWCLFVAIDLLDSLPPQSTNQMELAWLNLRVSKIAKNKGSVDRENELLHKGMKCLEMSVNVWEEYYDLTLELCNAMISSDHSLGSYEKANKTIDKVLQHAKSIEEKIPAYSYQILCKCDQTFDYKTGASDCVTVLNMYGFGIPSVENMSKAYMMKEEMKVKAALRYRSYSCLTKLPFKEDPIFALFVQGQKYSSYSGNDSLTKILSWKAIRCAVKRGMSRDLPLVMVTFAALLSKQGEVKTAQELGHITIALADLVKDNSTGSCAFAQQIVYSAIVTQLQSFQSTVEPLYRCHLALKLCGANAEWTLGAMLGHIECYFAAGLDLDALLETKLILMEQLCRYLERMGLLISFQIFRQFTQNLRKRCEHPTLFIGEIFHEEDALKEMNPNAHKMTIRDSSSMRLQLAFIFWDVECMEQMLKRLHEYPMKDLFIARLHNRLSFTGLAAFGIHKRNGCESFLKLGQDCLDHFKHLAKHGSVNAKPVYMFMLAMQSPSSDAFEKAIGACAEAGMIHLEAMANERYAMFLYEDKIEALANEYMTSSFWLYQDWGAQAKVIQLTQQYNFLKNTTRKNPRSMLSSITTGSSIKSKEHLVSAPSFNSRCKGRRRKFMFSRSA